MISRITPSLEKSIGGSFLTHPMMRLKIFSYLIGQLFQQTFGLSFVAGKQHTAVCRREVLNDRVVGIGREDPYCFRAINLI